MLLERELPKSTAKRILRKSLAFLNDILLEDDNSINASLLDKSQIISLGKLLAQMTQPDQFPHLYRCIDLWIWCYRICKYLEGDLTETKLMEFYREYGKVETVREHILPSRSLMILSRAHEVLGESKKCSKNEV